MGTLRGWFAMLVITSLQAVALCAATWSSGSVTLSPPPEGTYGPGTVTFSPGPPPGWLLAVPPDGLLTIPESEASDLHELALEIARTQGDGNNTVKLGPDGHIVGVRTR